MAGNWYVLQYRNVRLQLYRDGLESSIGGVNVSSGTDDTFYTFTTDTDDNYSVEVMLMADTTYINNGSMATNKVLTGNVSYKLILPSDAISILGYDGYASNFGNGKVVYFGGEKTVISYGNSKLRFSTNAIEKYAGNTVSTTMNNGMA